MQQQFGQSDVMAAILPMQGAGVIAGLVKQAAGRISIMIGGGVTAANAATLLAETGAQELHSSAKRWAHMHANPTCVTAQTKGQ